MTTTEIILSVLVFSLCLTLVIFARSTNATIKSIGDAFDEATNERDRLENELCEIQKNKPSEEKDRQLLEDLMGPRRRAIIEIRRIDQNEIFLRSPK